jgi:DNA polymerase III delta prime subunit
VQEVNFTRYIRFLSCFNCVLILDVAVNVEDLKQMPIYKIWSHICNGFITEVDYFLQFEDDDLKWEEEVKYLLVRDCYEDLYNKLVEAMQTKSKRGQHWLLLGTPGIGKTLFGLYLIYKIVKSAKNNSGENIPSFIYSDREGEAVYLSFDGQPRIASYRKQVADYVISDTIRKSSAVAQMFNLHITSVNNEGADAINKYNSANKLCMDVFAFEEYCILSKKIGVNKSDDELQFMYDIFGGSCRLLLANENIILKRDLYHVVLDEINFYFQHCFVKVKTKTRSNRTTKVVSKPITEAFEESAHRCAVVISNSIALRAKKSSMQVDNDAITMSLFMHKILDHDNVWEDAWASGFLKSLAGSIMDKKAHSY